MDEQVNDARSTWIERLKEGESLAQQQALTTYFDALVTFARKKLAGVRSREFDEEDVALSAFNSLFKAIDDNRLPNLNNRTDLWKILLVIASRKATKHRRRTYAKKRGGNAVGGESVFMVDSGSEHRGIENSPMSDPTPEEVAALTETYEEMLAMLEDETLRAVAEDRLQGYTAVEIAERVGFSPRTIERKLQSIRDAWQPYLTSNGLARR